MRSPYCLRPRQTDASTLPTNPPDVDSTNPSSRHLFTVVWDDLGLQKFTGNNLNVGNFLKEIESERSRRGVTTDKDTRKIAILRSRVDLGNC